MPHPFAMWPIFVGISLCVVIGIIALALRGTRKKEDVYRLNESERTRSSSMQTRANKLPAQTNPPENYDLSPPRTTPRGAAKSPMRESKKATAVTLKTLLQVAPFPEENRRILLERYDELDD